MESEDKKVEGKKVRLTERLNKDEKLNEKLDEKLKAIPPFVLIKAVEQTLRRVFALTNGLDKKDVTVERCRVNKQTHAVSAVVVITTRESRTYQSTIEVLFEVDKLYSKAIEDGVDLSSYL